MDPAKRRASYARYNASEKGQARIRRYRTSARCAVTQATINTRQNPRRVYVGKRYVSLAESAESARALNAHIKDRLHAFVENQRGTVEPRDEPAD